MKNDSYAPQPGKVRKVIVLSAGKVSTYQNLIEAVTAVYRLDDQLKEAVETAIKMATTGGDEE